MLTAIRLGVMAIAATGVAVFTIQTPNWTHAQDVFGAAVCGAVFAAAVMTFLFDLVEG